MEVIFTQTQVAQQMGEYTTTAIDTKKTAVDFLLISTSPYIIKWANGNTETVSLNKLAKLQAKHTWATDF